MIHSEDRIKVLILDKSLNLVAEIDLEDAARDFTSFTYVKKLNGWGSFSGVVLWQDSPYAQYLLPDYRYVIQRQVTGTNVWVNDFVGFIRRIEYFTPETDTQLVQTWGREASSLLGRYLIEPDSGDAFVEMTGYADDLVKALVRRECINNASKAFPNLVVNADTSSSSKEMSIQVRNENLYDVISKIRDSANDFDFNVTINDDLSALVFDTYAPQFGRDLTTGNTDGNEPLIFSIENRNMRMPRYWKVGFDAKTQILVLGQGYMETRNTVTVSADDDTIAEWGLAQGTKDAKDLIDEDALIDAGESALEDQGPQERMDFKTFESPSTRYWQHWRLGDWVTAQYMDIEADFAIEEIRIVVSNDKTEEITPKLRQLAIRTLT